MGESLEMACVKAEGNDKKVFSFVYRSSPVVQGNQDGKSEFQRVASMQGASWSEGHSGCSSRSPIVGMDRNLYKKLTA